MTWLDHVASALAILIPVLGALWKLATNHLRHIDKKLDRIEGKIDQHISDHAKAQMIQ